MSPFIIKGPAVVSFSGGRTSALMLARMVEAGLKTTAAAQRRMFDNTLFAREAGEPIDPTDLDECGGYCESNREAA